jgi:probable phosphoglycerate mutase
MAEIEGGAGMPKGMAVIRELAAAPLETPTREFYFLRHGQTDGNLRRIYQGPDTPLNATGLEQARAAAEILADEPITTILASDMNRAWVTAETTARHHSNNGHPSVKPRPLPWLRERSFGALIGSPSHDIDWAAAPEAGEPPSAFVARARTGLAHGISHGDRTLMVAHGGLLYVLSAMLGTRMTDAYFQNATPLLFRREGDGWTCEMLGG